MALSVQDLINQYGTPIKKLDKPDYTNTGNTADINTLRAQQSRLDRLADNPLEDAGVQSTLRGVQTGLATTQQSAIAAAKGRAAQTGQAGFVGALGGAANRAISDRALGYGLAQSQLAASTAASARAGSIDLAKNIVTAQQAAEQIATQRAAQEQAARIAELQAEQARAAAVLNAGVAGRGQDVTAETAAKEDITKNKAIDVTAKGQTDSQRLAEEAAKQHAKEAADDLLLRQAAAKREADAAEIDRQLKALALAQAKETSQANTAATKAAAQLKQLETERKLEELRQVQRSQQYTYSGGTTYGGTSEKTADQILAEYYKNPANRGVVLPNGRNSGTTSRTR